MRLSFAAATRIVVSRNGDVLAAWLRSDWQAGRKLQIVPITVEEFPPASLFDVLVRSDQRAVALHDPPRLLYVGRLHREKLCGDLVSVMYELKQRGVRARLILAGQGPEMETMRIQAQQLGVVEDIDWLGFVPSDDLGKVYAEADVFLSTVTGTSLREAGLAGLPIVGYDADWVRMLLTHEKTALLVPVGDPEALAAQVARILENEQLRQRIAIAFCQEARGRWNKNLIASGLRATFELERAL
jgi:glycosyltransferase involved in cell wall biosynthesis